MPRFTSHPRRIAALLVLVLGAALAGCGDDPLQPLEGPADVALAVGAGAAESYPIVSSGLHHSCAITADGKAICWGSNEFGQSAAPAGEFIDISAGWRQSCGVTADGSLACWGQDFRGMPQPTGEFVQVSAGVDHACALTTDGDIECWGWDYDGQVSGTGTKTAPYSTVHTHEGDFVEVSSGLYHTCARTAEGAVACWGRNDVGAITPAPGTYTQLSSTWYRSCGLRTDGTIACWGNNGNGQGNVPAGTYTEVSAGAFHTCGVTTDGDVVCWGYDGWGQVSGAPGELTGALTTHEGPFTHVSAGMYHTCAVRADATFVCWGAGTTNTGIEPHYGQAAPPQLNAPQAITFMSAPPAPAILGGTYTASATGGGSGNPVTHTSLTPGVCTVGASSGGSATVSLNAIGTCTIAADQAGSVGWLPAARATQTFAVVYNFGGSTGGGFAPPVSSTTFNSTRAGQAVPIKFDLGGDQGLSVVASGWPKSAAIACPDGDAPVNVIAEATETPGSSALKYDAATGLYTYVWKTDRTWAGTCREFVLRLADGTEHRAVFDFTR